MGRKAIFTRDEVFDAAEAIAAQGEDVTVRTLHGYLGGSSFSSVLKHLNDWKATKVISEAPKTEMPQSVANLFESAWKAATAQASKDLALEREKAALQVEDAENRVLEAITAIEDLENANNELQDKLAEAHKKVSDVESSLLKLSNDKSGLVAVCGELKDQAKTNQHNLEKLQLSYDQLQKKYSDDVNALQKQHSEEVSKLTIDVAKLEAARDNAKEEVEKNRERIIVAAEESKVAMAKLEAKIDTAIKEKELVMKQASELTGRLEAIEQHNKELLAKVKAKPEKD